MVGQGSETIIFDSSNSATPLSACLDTKQGSASSLLHLLPPCQEINDAYAHNQSVVTPNSTPWTSAGPVPPSSRTQYR